MKKFIGLIFVFLSIFLISCEKSDKVSFVNKTDSYEVFLPNIWKDLKTQESENRFMIEDEKGNLYLMIGTFSEEDEKTFSNCANNVVEDSVTCNRLTSNFIGRNKENKGIFWVKQQDAQENDEKFFDSLGGFENTLKYLQENIKFN